jgi:pimeloyl-ACP methyl ester carboxylesterase
MRQQYLGEAGKQIHLRICEPNGDPTRNPLICLPPAPHSGLYFNNVLVNLAKDRIVIAVDTPGYGGSDRLSGDVSITAYAKRLSEVCNAFSKVDIMGFHSGCLVVLDLADILPEVIDKVVMIDVPFLSAKQRAAMAKKFAQQTPLPNSTTDLQSGFDMQVTNRLEDLGPERAHELWIETLRAGTGLNDMFRAAFAFDCETRFAEFKRQVDIIATKSSLLEPSRAAAQALSTAVLHERLDIDRAVFEIGADKITQEILKVLAA